MRQNKAVLEAVGTHARTLRTERKLRQRQVADSLGLDTPAVSRIESGDRDIRLTQAARLARTLGVRLSELVAPADEAVATRKGSISRAMGEGMTERRGKAGRR